MDIQCPSCKAQLSIDYNGIKSSYAMTCHRCAARLLLIWTVQVELVDSVAPQRGVTSIQPEQKQGEIGSTYEAQRPLNEKTVLIAIDGDASRGVIKELLHRGGFSIIEASDGRDALEQLQRERPAIALLDVGLPQMFGFELCDIIKKSPLLKGIGVILIASIYDKTRYKRAPQSLYGADDYIERHHIEDELLIKVQRLINSLKRGSGSAPSEVSQSVGAPGRREGQMASRIDDAGLGDASETTRQLDSLPLHRSQDHMDEITLGKHSGIVNPSHPTGETLPAQKQVTATGNSLAHDTAKRLARIIISDITLYNQKSVEEGLREGNFTDRLKGELEEGRRLYRERVSREVLDSTDFFEEAIREFIHNRMPMGK